MYIPAHLSGVHKTLLQFGHNMRQKHGPEFKRNVRFDDTELTLCIDIKLPGSGSKWVTVSHEHALADRRALSRSIEFSIRDELTSEQKDATSSQPSSPSLSAAPASALQLLAKASLVNGNHGPLTPSTQNASCSAAPMEEGTWGAHR